jgi:serine protease Do
MRIGIVFAAAVAAGTLAAQQPPEPPEAPRAPRARTERRVYVGPRVSSYLGVGVADIDAERAKALKLPDVHGAEVKNVADESPAGKAGLKEGDVILQYNGQRVEGSDQLQRLARETPAGREVKLQIWRNGASQTVTLTMGSRRGRGFGFADGREFTFEMPGMPPMPHMPDMPSGMMSWRSPVLGVESESLGSQLAQYFGVKEGVLVRSVIKGSAAEKAGIKAGDVILKVDGSTVTSPREISSVLRSARGNKRTLPVLIQRDRKEMTVNVTLEDESSTPRRNSIRTVTVSTSC